jgi:hypothetical protein
LCALLRIGVCVVVALGWAATGIPASAEAVEPLAPPNDTKLSLAEGIPVTFTWRAVGAPPIRVLLVPSSESSPLSRHVAHFEQSLKRSSGPLVRVATLSEADVIVQFTAYRRTVGDKGQTQDWWQGEFKPLKVSLRDTRLGPPVPERFALLVADRVSGDAEAAVELLAKLLSRALGRESPPVDVAV